MSKSPLPAHNAGIVAVMEIVAACALTVVLLAVSAGLSRQRMQLNAATALASERQQAMNLLQRARALGQLPSAAELPMEAEAIGDGLVRIQVRLSDGATLSTLLRDGEMP